MWGYPVLYFFLFGVFNLKPYPHGISKAVRAPTGMMTPSQEVLHQGAGMVADSDQLTERRPFAFSRVERVVENDGIFKLHLVPAKGICHIQHPANEMTFLKVSVQDWMHYKFRKFW